MMRREELIYHLKHNRVGVAVLTVGVIAVLTVCWLAYQALAPTDGNEKVKISKEEISSFKEQAQQPVKERPAPVQKPRYQRQPSISEQDIIGSWDTRIEEGRALLQIKNGTYRLIIVMDNPAVTRRYSNGTYQLYKDLLILYPNTAWGAPKSEKFDYSILTRAKMPMMVAKYKGNLVFQLPPPEVDIYVPNYHPLLNLATDKIAVWDVLK